MQATDFEFLKDRYDAELARCNRLTDSLALPVAALTALGGLIGVMATAFSFTAGHVTTFFEAALVVDCCAFGVCLMFLAVAYYRQDVAYLQTLGELELARTMLERVDPSEAGTRFEEYVRRSIIEATDVNAASNDRRAAYLYRARAALLVVVLSTGVAGVPYTVDQIKEPRKIPVVHIENLDRPAGMSHGQ